MNELKVMTADYERVSSEINKEIHNCKRCIGMVEKFETEKTVYFGSNNDIVILGEAPANNGWRKSGVAWHDINGKLLPSGKVMDNLLNEIGYLLKDITFLEAIKCFPLDRKHLNKCSENCYEYLARQLYILNPKVILALGDTATRRLIPIRYKKFEEVVGNIYEVDVMDKKMKVIPIYHPSPISPKSYKGNIPIFQKIKEII